MRDTTAGGVTKPTLKVQDKLLADITERAQRFEELMNEASSGEYDEHDDSGPGPYAELVAPLTALFQRTQRTFERGRSPGTPGGPSSSCSNARTTTAWVSVRSTSRRWTCPRPGPATCAPST